MTLELFQYEFMRHALYSGMILGPMCGFLGVFITLRGMAFFSDAIAHSALTGVAIGLVLQQLLPMPINLTVIVLLFSLGLSGAMAYFFQRTTLKPDTIIAFAFTGSLALGVLVIRKLGKYQLIDGMLFGDIYSNSLTDILWQGALALFIFGFFSWNMKAYVLAMVQPDLARVQGLNLARLDNIFALIIAASVTLCMKMLGALLLSGLIVIPPAAAKLLANNFREMLIFSILIGLSGAVLGVIISYYADTPTGATIVMVNVAFLLVSFGRARFRTS